MKRVGIIGAGRFGLSLAEALAEAGTEVLLIDRNKSIVQDSLKKVTWAVAGDGTNAAALEDAGIKECDTVVVAIGSNIEASMLVTATCMELGVATVVSKATSSELDSAAVSACPNAAMPGPSGINVPIRPSIGLILAAMLLRPVMRS